MTETLAGLVSRRLTEMGRQRGRSGPVSLLQAWKAYNGRVAYETVRRVAAGEHTNIRDETVDELAGILEVDPADILVLLGRPPRLGPFVLPREAERLGVSERRAVLGVVWAILRAHEDTLDASSSDAVTHSGDVVMGE